MDHIVGSAKNLSKRIIKSRYLFLKSILIVTFLFLVWEEDFNMIFVIEEKTADEWFTINTEGCRIPALKAFDESFNRFVEYPFILPHCPHAKYALLERVRSRIRIRHRMLPYYNINKTVKLSCCYRSFYRPVEVDDIGSKNIDDRSKYSSCIMFQDSIQAKDEFVRVTCNIGKNKIYDQFFLFARKKKFKEHGVDEIMIEHNETVYNVVVLGIDSVSRLNFHRTMPKTAKYLRMNGAVEFLGYNKVGNDKFSNLVPMLTGLKETELDKTCYPHDTTTFDNCPFLWEWFKQKGFYTAYGEDVLGTFNHPKPGFTIAPTDYYLHTFMVQASKHVGAYREVGSFLCMHDIYFYKVMLNYVEELTWNLRNKKLFGFFWETSMSHVYVNYPMKMDTDYLNLFATLDASGYSSKTLIFLVSDRGIRWDSIRITKQERLEERLPFLYILLPRSFRNKYKDAYNNLKLNSKRLITPFDVHATVSDLINLKDIEKGTLSKRSKERYANKRGISLFLPVPVNRTCETADIDYSWCTCHKQITLTKDDPHVFEAAKILVMSINSLLKDYPQCAKLTVSDMVDVTEIEAGKAEPKESTWREYMAVVKTTPGSGIFEAVLRQDSFDLSWKLLGTPNRLNLYGNNSRCISNDQIQVYCYCIT